MIVKIKHADKADYRKVVYGDYMYAFELINTEAYAFGRKVAKGEITINDEWIKIDPNTLQPIQEELVIERGCCSSTKEILEKMENGELKPWNPSNKAFDYDTVKSFVNRSKMPFHFRSACWVLGEYVRGGSFVNFHLCTESDEIKTQLKNSIESYNFHMKEKAEKEFGCKFVKFGEWFASMAS